VPEGPYSEPGSARGGARTLSGGDLTAPRFVKTNDFGNYKFGDLTAGQIYFVSVASKCHLFHAVVNHSESQ
jgi:hypothetical protein